MQTSTRWVALWVSAVLVSAWGGCGTAEDLVEAVEEAVTTCGPVCEKISECSATPPSPEFGSFEMPALGGAGDCAAACADADQRALRGYSACQIDCINESGCGDVNDCWKASSATYASFCLPEPPPAVMPDPAEPPPVQAPENTTVTGDEEADRVVENPAVAEAVADNDDFDVNFGDEPPVLEGRFSVYGTIDESQNARPVGAVIDTSICFTTDPDNPTRVTYCEDGTGLPQTSAPITGSGEDFTVFFEYSDVATLLFSGKVVDGKAQDVHALVVYLHAVDVWERSATDWEQTEPTCNACQ